MRQRQLQGRSTIQSDAVREAPGAASEPLPSPATRTPQPQRQHARRRHSPPERVPGSRAGIGRRHHDQQRPPLEAMLRQQTTVWALKPAQARQSSEIAAPGTPLELAMSSGARWMAVACEVAGKAKPRRRMGGVGGMGQARGRCCPFVCAPSWRGAAAVEGSALDSQLQRRHGGASRYPGVHRSRGWSRAREVEQGTGPAAQRRTVDNQEKITFLADNLARCTHARRLSKCRARHTARARRLGCLTYIFHSSGDISHSSRRGDPGTP